jgi:hypothetical protein
VNIRRFRCGGWRFRLTATYFFTSAKKSKQKTLAPAFGPRRLGFLRSVTDPGAAATVCFAAPPSAVFDFVERSLRSHARINPSTQPSDVAVDQDQDQKHSSLRSLLSGAASPRAAALLCLCFCRSEPARKGGLTADLFLVDVLDSNWRSCRRLRSFDLAFAFLWERACSQRRPDSRPVSR